MDLLRLVTKTDALPASYRPADLVPVSTVARTVRGEPYVRQVVIPQLTAMIKAMQTAGLSPYVSSAFRSYQEQETTYAYWVQTLGKEEADRQSARPGHSEHQLGTAIDFASAGNNFDLEETFATTKEGVWLAAHAADYGFVLSYPKGKESITGYAYEPWHYRYFGADTAKKIVQSGLTTTEYLRRLR